MSIFLFMLAAYGVGYLTGFITREVYILTVHQVGYLKERKQLAEDIAYDKAVEKADREEKEGLPDPDSVSEDQPEKEDEEEKQNRRGTLTFFS